MKQTFFLFLAAFTAFTGTPIFMIGNSPIDYDFIVTDIFFITAISFSLTLGIFLYLINFLLSYKKLNNLRIFYIYFIASWIVLAGFIFPVSTSTGMTNPNVNPINLLNLSLVVLFSLILGISSLTKVRKYIQIFLATIIFVSLTSSAIAIFNSEINVFNFKGDDLNEKNLESRKLSNKKNIFVMSFDGLPGNMVVNILKSDKTLSQKFKDFIIFENAISQSPATGASLLGNIFGTHDYKSKGKNIEEVLSTLKKEGYYDYLPWKNIQDSYQFYYNQFKIKPMYLDNDGNYGLTRSIATFDFFRYTIIRIGTRYSLKLLDSTKSNIFNYCRNLIKSEFLNDIDIDENYYDLQKKLVNHKGPEWDNKFPLHMAVYDKFISSLSSSNKSYSLRYMHFLFTHYPVNFDENCEYRSDDKSWYEANQNENGLKNLTKCALKQYASFLDKLKELKVYDKTLVVLKSDHGKPQYYFSKPPHNLKINNHHRLGYNRYKPTLMIKDFSTNNQNPKFKSELVSLNDMAKTICEKSNTQSKIYCEKFNGVNLFDDLLVTEQPYYIYVVPHSSANHKFEQHISIKVPSRNISMLEALENSEFVDLTEETEKNIYLLVK